MLANFDSAPNPEHKLQEIKKLILNQEFFIFDVDGTLYFNGPEMRHLHQVVYAEFMWKNLEAIRIQYPILESWQIAFVAAVNPAEGKKRSPGDALRSLGFDADENLRDSAKDAADVEKSKQLQENQLVRTFFEWLNVNDKKLAIITAAAQQGTEDKLKVILGEDHQKLFIREWTATDRVEKKFGTAYTSFMEHIRAQGLINSDIPQICVVSNSLEKDLYTAIGKGATLLIHLDEKRAQTSLETGVQSMPTLSSYQNVKVITMGDINQLADMFVN